MDTSGTEKLKSNHLDSEARSKFQTNTEKTTKYQSKLVSGSSIKKKYKCPFCPTMTTGYIYLQIHVATLHSTHELSIEKTQRQCTFCTKSFTTYASLVRNLILREFFITETLSRNTKGRRHRDSRVWGLNPEGRHDFPSEWYIAKIKRDIKHLQQSATGWLQW